MQSCIVSVVLLFLSTFICKASAIHCFYCNSANNSACLDVNHYEEELRTRVIPVVNCDTAIPSPVAVNFFCRKIVQTIFHSHRDSEVRVTRGCGWVKDHRDCYRADNMDHLETVCQCFTDHCNGSRMIQGSAVTLTLSLLLGLAKLFV